MFVIISWFFSILVLLFTISSIISGNIFGVMFYIIAVLAIFPPFTKLYIIPKIKKHTTWVSPLAFTFLILVSVSTQSGLVKSDIPNVESTRSGSSLNANVKSSSIKMAQSKQNQEEKQKDIDNIIKNTQEVKIESITKNPFGGQVISGIGREEIENKYNEAENKSKLKADEYAKSIKGKKIEWIAKIYNVDTNFTGDTYLLAKMGIYSVHINDPQKKFTDFNKGDLVKITGTIDNLSSLFGISVTINPNMVEIAKPITEKVNQ